MQLRKHLASIFVLLIHSKNYFFHCKKCDNDWFIQKKGLS